MTEATACKCGEAKALGKQLADVQKEMSNSSGNVTELIQRERELEKAIENTNQQIDRRKRLNDIEGKRSAKISPRSGQDSTCPKTWTNNLKTREMPQALQ